MTEYDEDRWWENIGIGSGATPGKAAPDPLPAVVLAGPADIEATIGDTPTKDTIEHQDAPRDALPGEAVPGKAGKGEKLPDISVPGPVPTGPTSQKPRCAHISSTGASCGAWAVKDSAFCFYHDPRPDAIAKRERSRAKGNRRSNAQDGLPDWESRTLDTLESVRDALSELFNAGAKGDITAARLSALSAISNSISKAIEGSDIEARLAALEEKVEGKK
jgi:hypothetical protein